MEGIIVTILILTAILGIELQYIVGKLATPPNMVYLGTVHWPSDYFYYLSQFAQGTYNFLSSTMLFTPEKLKPVLVGWQNVLTGRICPGRRGADPTRAGRRPAHHQHPLGGGAARLARGADRGVHDCGDGRRGRLVGGGLQRGRWLAE